MKTRRLGMFACGRKLWTAALVVLAVTAASCSKGDDDGGGHGNGDGTQGDSLSITPDTCETGNEFFHPEERDTVYDTSLATPDDAMLTAAGRVAFYYDDRRRLVSVRGIDASESLEIKYVEKEDLTGTPPAGQSYATIKNDLGEEARVVFNRDGYITRIESTVVTGSGDSRREERIEIHADYEDDGTMYVYNEEKKGWLGTGSNRTQYDRVLHAQCSFSGKSGGSVKVEEHWFDNDVTYWINTGRDFFARVGEERVAPKANVYRQYTMAVCNAVGFSMWGTRNLALAGLFGKAPDTHPRYVFETVTTEDVEKEKREIKMSYSRNAKGFVKTETIGDETYRYTYRSDDR